MAIILKSPRLKNTTYEFEISANNQIKITSIKADGSKGTPFLYRLNAIRDLYLWLKDTKNGEWVTLGSRDEVLRPNAKGQIPILIEGSVEAWARPPCNEWYGLTANQRGRFATFVPPILEYMGLAEVEHKQQGNRMRARPLTPLDAKITTRH